MRHTSKQNTKYTHVLTEHSSGHLLWRSRLKSCTRVDTEAMVDLPVQISSSGKGTKLGRRVGLRQLESINVTNCEEKTWAVKSVRNLLGLVWGSGEGGQWHILKLPQKLLRYSATKATEVLCRGALENPSYSGCVENISSSCLLAYSYISRQSQFCQSLGWVKLKPVLHAEP